MDLKRLFRKSATNKKCRDGIENSIAQKHYDKPRKARNVKPLDFTFLRVLSSLGRGIFMPSLRFLFQSGLREVFSNPCRQVVRWQLVFIKPRLTLDVGFLSCKRTAQRGKGNGICQCSDCGTKDLKPELDNVDLQILRLSFTT